MRAILLSLLAVVLIVLPVSLGQAANSSSPISWGALTLHDTPTQPISVSPVGQTVDSIAHVPQLLPTGFFTAYLPLVMYPPDLPYSITLQTNPGCQIIGNGSVLTATVRNQSGSLIRDGTAITFTTDLGNILSPAMTKNGAATSQISSTQVGAAHITAMSGTAQDTAKALFTVNTGGTPNDPTYPLQWGLSKINAPGAWSYSTGACIVIAVVDTGVSSSHPDLEPKLIPGASFVPSEPSVEDGDGHGSNVAGIAAATTDNSTGVAGVGWGAQILPVKVLDSTGSGYTSWVASGITFAADRANVLNLSLGGTSDSTTLRNAINYAADTRGRLVVAAAGNCGDAYYRYNGCTYMNQPVYPGAYSNVMAVAAVDWDDSKASFSNQGAYVDIAAPGVDIYNTYKNGGYTSESGTSQATPHVAGLAALIWARYPTYTAAQVRNQIQNTAVDLGTAGWDQQFGWGRIDARAALGLTLSDVTPIGQAKSARVELTAPVDHREADIAPGRALVKFRPAISTASIHQALDSFSGVSVESQIEALDVQVLRVPVGQEWSLIDQLRALPGVEYAEPDYAVQLIR